MPIPLNPAIVLASFGTSDVEALEAILNVEKRTREAFGDYEIHMAFTSNVVRKIWHRRAADPDFRAAHPQVPEGLYSITNPLTTLALIQEQGFRTVLVQSLHITNGSEWDYVQSIVRNLGSITALQKNKIPFPYIALGDSALGDGSPARQERAVRAIEPLVKEARSEKAALVFMGHGNDLLDISAYRDFAATARHCYEHPVFIGLVEGNYLFEDLLAELKQAGIKKILLAPLMLVAGEHAKNDMAGNDPDSWVNQLQREGFAVELKVKGLGLLDDWADIYVEHLKEVETASKKVIE